MATSKQEKIYSKIIEYYDFADELINISASTPSTPEGQSQLMEIEAFIADLEKYADELSEEFLEFVKNGYSEENTKSIAESFKNLTVKITECKNRIKMIFDQQ